MPIIENSIDWVVYDEQIKKREQDEQSRRLYLEIPLEYLEQEKKKEEVVEPRRVIEIDL
jgi:hypothetical protein